ncbi:MAG: class I SAM-dependent methyltransferase [Oscillospiraceae bacterium]|nr:class I SAM-dependent methyltransferase [Oscillospiraceae bacterium]
MPERSYYHAYDDRYKQVHGRGLQWFSAMPSPIVAETIREFSILPGQHKLLEIGCGEGRDAFPLLEEGFDLLATDISPAAVDFCRNRRPDHAGSFRVLDCVTENLPDRFDLIYAVAVVHMLVPDEDRDAFYRFVREHLTPSGIGLICTMGDGSFERQSDISTAFDLQDRVHEQTGTPVRIAGTSCRMVSFDTFERELARNGLRVVRKGITAVEPDFPEMMFAAVRKEK